MLLPMKGGYFMKWKIISDTSTDIIDLSDLSTNIDYERVPFVIDIDGQSYHDDLTTSTEQFIELYSHAKANTSTACPSPQDFLNAFEGAEQVLCFTISKNVSGSYNSANIAKDMFLEKHPEASIYIFDSQSSSAEVNLLIRKAVELIEKNDNFNTVIDELKKYHEHTDVNFLLLNVENLVKNGRVNRFIGQMIGLLNIRLIGKRTPDGRIELACKAKGKKRSHRTLLNEMIKQGYQGDYVEIAHAHNITEAEQFDELIKSEFPNAKSLIIETSGLNAYYAEKDGLIIGYEKS